MYPDLRGARVLGTFKYYKYTSFQWFGREGLTIFYTDFL